MNKVSLEVLKFNPIRKKYDNGVEIYNLDNEKRNVLLKIMENNIKDNNEIEINGKQVLLEVLPLLTNIDLNGLDEEVIEEVLNSPSDILEEVFDEIASMTTNFFNRIVKNIDMLNKMNPEQRELFIKNMKIEEQPTEEELELLKKAEELKKKYNKE